MPERLVFVGIDGTGCDDDVQYAETFKLSYVHTLSRRIQAGRKLYHRGPCLYGTATSSLAQLAVNTVKSAIDRATIDFGATRAVADPSGEPVGADEPRNKGLKVCLSGYSRGGYAVVLAARQLMAENINVDYLILFDAVDRSPTTTSCAQIPPNVKNVWHAMRSPHSRSRNSFGNTATSWTQYTKGLEKNTFMTTHGGMGGTPWCTDPAYRKMFKSINGRPSPNWGKVVREMDLGDKPERVESAAQSVQSIRGLSIAFPSINALAVGAQMAAHTAREEEDTSVTFEQDLIGSEDVWDWMIPQLALAGLAVGGAWPLAGVRGELSMGVY